MQLSNTDRFQYILPYYNYDQNLKQNYFDGLLSFTSSGSNSLNETNSNLSEFSNSFTDLELIIQNLNQSSENLNSILSEISSGDGTVNKLIYDDSMIKSLNAASENINLLLEDLRLNPKRYVHFSLFGKKK